MTTTAKAPEAHSRAVAAWGGEREREDREKEVERRVAVAVRGTIMGLGFFAWINPAPAEVARAIVSIDRAARSSYCFSRKGGRCKCC